MYMTKVRQVREWLEGNQRKYQGLFSHCHGRILDKSELKKEGRKGGKEERRFHLVKSSRTQFSLAGKILRKGHMAAVLVSIVKKRAMCHMTDFS